MFGKFGSLLSFRGHSIGGKIVRVLGAQPKRRQSKHSSSEIAQSSEQLESRRLLTNTLDVNVSRLANSQAEVSIAVNPTDPQNLVILSNGGDANGNEQFLAYTTNGGQSWTRAPLDNLDDGVGSALSDRFDGAVRYDAFGNCHIIYMARNASGSTAMVYGLSTNGGQTFVTQVVDPLTNGSDKPWIATGPDATNLSNQCVIITFKDDTGNLVARSASVSGLGTMTGFTPKVTYGTVGNYGVPAIGPNGQVVMTWQNPAGGQSNGNALFTVDPNGTQGGLSFGPFTTITSTNLGGFDYIAATPDRSTFASPYVAYDLSNGPNRGRLYVAYGDEIIDESDNSDIFVRFSDNNGLSWSPRVRVNDDGGTNSQFFQNISVDPVTGTLFVGFYDARNDNGGMLGTDSDGNRNNDVQYWGSQSVDGGVTWSPNFQISDGASNQARDVGDFGNDFGDYTDVAIYNGVGYAVWADNSNSTGDNPGGNGTLDVYFDSVVFNVAPTVSLATPGTVTINEGTTTGPLDFTVSDDITLPANLIVTATSSNQALIPNNQLALAIVPGPGNGTDRTITATPFANASGRTTITLTVSDGGLTSTTTFDILVLPLPDPLPIPPGSTLTTTPFTETTLTPIADATSTISSAITVSGLDPVLYDVDVSVNITHPANSELNVVLISARGTRVTLTSGNGGVFANVFAGTTFDDQIVTAPVTDYLFQDTVVAPYLVPEGALAQLMGEDPNGDWTLEITDLNGGNVGDLNDWGLNLTTLPALPNLQTFIGDAAIVTPRPIPDTGSPVLLPLTFNGLDPFTWDVNLRLDIDHTNSGDLEISLISPNGTEIAISTRNGGGFDNIYNSATFDDQATTGGPITDVSFANLTSIGSVISEAALSGFLGEDPNGTWLLKIVDRSVTGTGRVVGWGLDITTIFVNDPPTLGAINNPGAILEDAAAVTILLNSISPGGGETQPLKVTAFSDNPAVIPDPSVTYTTPSNGGALTFQPLPDAFGVVTITVTVEDGGYDQDLLTTADNAITSKSFVIVVNAVNDAPTINPVVADNVVTDLGTFDEDFGELNLALTTLTGISAGGGENQKLQITATSDQKLVIPDPIIDYTAGATTAVMHVRSNLDFNGLVLLTVQVMDAGLDNDLLTLTDNLIKTRTFSVNVRPVNDPPTLAPINDPTPINEDAPIQSLVLSNITAGGQETQPLRVTVTSSDLSVVSDVNVSYNPGNPTANLFFRPAVNGFGTAVITVVVEDGGLDGNLLTTADNLSVTQVFNVTINQVNDPPVFATLGDTRVLDEDPGNQMLNLSGISAGPQEIQDLAFTVTSSNTALIPTPILSYGSPGDVGTLFFNVAPESSGSSTITLTLMDAGMDGDLLTLGDNQSFTRTLLVVIRPINDLPLIDAIPDPAPLTEGDGNQTIQLTGISAGSTEIQPIKVEAFSNQPAIIASPLVNYVSGAATGLLSFTPEPDQFGTVTISVRVTDGGLDADLSTDADNGITTLTFVVTVNPVNDDPHFDFIQDPAPIDESLSPTSVMFDITGITAGPNEFQELEFVVDNGGATKITDPVIQYQQGSTSATLSFTPKPGQFGIVPVIVTVNDPGDDGDPLTLGDNRSYSQTFNVRINAVNDPPTLDPISDPNPVSEDAGTQTVPLINVSPGAANESAQPLLVTAVSSNPSLVNGFVVLVNGSGIPVSLTYALGQNQSGTALVTVTLADGGLDNNLSTTNDNATITRQFTVNVNSVNDAPSLDIVDSQSVVLQGRYDIAEDSGAQLLTLANITPGQFENQPVKITTTVGAGALNLITPPVVTYTSPNSQGTLTFTPLANKSGTAVVNIRVEDGGVDANLLTTNDNLFVTYDLNINIAEVNDPPTLDVITDPAAILEDAATQFLTLSGLSAGGGESQILSIVAFSDNPNLISDPQVVYTNGDQTATLIFTPTANRSGVAHIAVVVDDGGVNGFIQKTFTITVNPVNDAPTINNLGPTLTIDEDSGEQTIDLTGMSAGPFEPGQLFSVSVSSNRNDIIPDPTLIYTPQSATGQITFTPLPDQSGTVILKVKVTDGGADNNLNTPADNVTTEATLTVNVTPTPEQAVVTIDEGTALSTGGRPVTIAPNATIDDSDSTDFNHGGVLVQLVDGGRSGDRLSLGRFGNGSSRISATRSGLLKRGRDVIGSVTGGTNGTALVISFNARISRTEVRNIVRNVHFSGKGSELGLRRVQIVVTDNTGIQAEPVERDVALN